MTRWLQGSPRELVQRARDVASGTDLRTLEGQDLARALLGACADMVEREVVGETIVPLHYSLRDRLKDALACLRSRAVALRYAASQ